MNAKDFFEEASMKQEKLIDEEIRRVRGILEKKNEKDLFNSPVTGESRK